MTTLFKNFRDLKSAFISISITIFIISGLVFQCLGQNNKYLAGIEIGPNVSGYHGEDASDYNYQMNYYLALSFQYNFPKNFSLKAGLSIERKGAQSEVTFTDIQGEIIGTYKLNENLDYLIIPIMAKASFGKKKMKFVVGTGFYGGYLLQAKWNSKEDVTINGTSLEDVDIKDYFKDTDYGILASIGFSINAGENICLTTELVENYGLPLASQQRDRKNNSLGLSFGVAYRFGTR